MNETFSNFLSSIQVKNFKVVEKIHDIAPEAELRFLLSKAVLQAKEKSPVMGKEEFKSIHLGIALYEDFKNSEVYDLIADMNIDNWFIKNDIYYFFLDGSFETVAKIYFTPTNKVIKGELLGNYYDILDAGPSQKEKGMGSTSNLVS